MEIRTVYDEKVGDWLGITDESPIMVVSADTEELARSIIQKNLVWYQERKLKKIELEVVRALNTVVRIQDTPLEPAYKPEWKGPGPMEDTAPSEMSGIYDQGC